MTKNMQNMQNIKIKVEYADSLQNMHSPLSWCLLPVSPSQWFPPHYSLSQWGTGMLHQQIKISSTFFIFENNAKQWVLNYSYFFSFFLILFIVFIIFMIVSEEQTSTQNPQRLYYHTEAGIVLCCKMTPKWCVHLENNRLTGDRKGVWIVVSAKYGIVTIVLPRLKWCFHYFPRFRSSHYYHFQVGYSYFGRHLLNLTAFQFNCRHLFSIYLFLVDIYFNFTKIVSKQCFLTKIDVHQKSFINLIHCNQQHNEQTE
jgi:hypothetical protein